VAGANVEGQGYSSFQQWQNENGRIIAHVSFLQNPLTKISLRNGAIAGIFAFAILLALYAIGKHPMLFQLYFDFRIILFGIFLTLTIKEIRDYYQNGIIYFWQGMIACFIFTIVFSILTSILILILCNFYEPFLTNYIELGVQQMKTLSPDFVKEIGKDLYEATLTNLHSMNGFELGKKYFWQSFLISFFISIIISVILRRQPKNE
jgi:hypothetical protein